MRKFSRFERATGLGLAAVLAAGSMACQASGGDGEPNGTGNLGSASPEASPTLSPTQAAKLFRGTVINSADSLGHNVGVLTYKGPNTDEQAGKQEGGAKPAADCITPGRTVIDKDVPPDQPPTESYNWYRLVQNHEGEPINPQWIGDGYFVVETPGTVPQCTDAQIAGN